MLPEASRLSFLSSSLPASSTVRLTPCEWRFLRSAFALDSSEESLHLRRQVSDADSFSADQDQRELLRAALQCLQASGLLKEEEEMVEKEVKTSRPQNRRANSGDDEPGSSFTSGNPVLDSYLRATSCYVDRQVPRESNQLPPIIFYAAPSSARAICTDVHPSAIHLAVGTENADLRVYDLSNSGRLFKFVKSSSINLEASVKAVEVNSSAETLIAAHSDSVFAVRFLHGPGYDEILSASGDGSILLHKLFLPNPSTSRFAYIPHAGPVIIFCLIHLNFFKMFPKNSCPTLKVLDLAVQESTSHRPHQFFASGSFDCTARLYDFHRADPIRILSSQCGPILKVRGNSAHV